MNLPFTLLASLVLCAATARSASARVPGTATRPSWIDDRPCLPGYLVGVGAASRDGDLGGTRNRALAHAMGDLALQMKTQVAGETTLHVRETAQYLIQDVDTRTHLRGQATIEDVEIVDTWMDGEHCWVYVRLSLDRREERRLGLDRKIDGMLDQLAAGDVAEAASLVPGLAAMSLLDHLEPDHHAAWSSAQIRAARIRARGALMGRLKGVTLHLSAPSGPVRRGADHEVSLTIAADHRPDRGPRSPVSGLPLRLSLTRGSGRIDSVVWTNASGLAAARLSRLWGPETRPAIRAVVDLGALAAAHGVPAPPRAFGRTSWLAGVPVPEATAELHAPRLAARLTCIDQNLGVSTASDNLARSTRQALADVGYELTGTGSPEALHLEVQTRTRNGDCLYGICFSYLDLGLRATDGVSGALAFERSITAIKGAGPTVERAREAALTRGAELLTATLISALTGRATVPALH